MSFSERPPLDAYTCEKIDAELHKFDELYWPKITAMRVKTYYHADVPVPPQRPQHLLHEIEWYAERLFKVEADYYDNFRGDLSYGGWLSYLVSRVLARVVKNLETLEGGVPGTIILGYHGLVMPHVEQHLLVVLNAQSLQYQQGIADSQRGAATLISSHAHNAQPESSVQITVAEQLRELKEECGVTAEEMAEALGVVPRSVFKHLAGNTVPRRAHLAAYERLFTDHLGRSVTFQKVSKRSHKSHGKGT